MSRITEEDLFGGRLPWDPNDWTSSDDRVRGGSSYSTITIASTSNTATFHGNLDISTLGGAGFASQRTTGTRNWDLSDYEGLNLHIHQSDGKRYVIVLKDDIQPKRPDGREQSTVSWERPFQTNGGSTVPVKWADLKATYRGRPVQDPKPIDLKNIQRISIMMRSFFGDQEGQFSLEIDSLSVFRADRDPKEEDG